MCSPKGFFFFFFFFSLVPVSFGSGNVGLQLIARLIPFFLFYFFSVSLFAVFFRPFSAVRSETSGALGRRRRSTRGGGGGAEFYSLTLVAWVWRDLLPLHGSTRSRAGIYVHREQRRRVN